MRAGLPVYARIATVFLPRASSGKNWEKRRLVQISGKRAEIQEAGC